MVIERAYQIFQMSKDNVNYMHLSYPQLKNFFVRIIYEHILHFTNGLQQSFRK